MILLDNNISPTLCKEFKDIYPGIIHVSQVSLENAGDIVVWEYAREKDLHIMTKDKDFIALLNQKGHPPKIIWLQLGNCTNKEIQAIIMKQKTTIKHFISSGKGILKIKN
jgi:predicted nuclease of predicted toxin-antitoxin system